MRIVHTGDIHLNESRIEEFDLMLAQLADSIKQQNPDLVVCGGDFLTHRDRLTPGQVILIRKLFKEYLADFKSIIIIGNHECAMSENKSDSISAIFSFDELEIHTKIGEHIDINDYRFHLFPYPSKAELVRHGLTDITEVYGSDVYKNFELAENKKNVLIFHGTMEGFNISHDYSASETAINTGKDLFIPKSFWSKFDAVMGSHLHKYQGIDNAVYAGCPFPLTYADSFSTGYVLWTNLSPSFVTLPALFPYTTYDLGKLEATNKDLSRALATIKRTQSVLKNNRIRVKYKILQSNAGILDHGIIGKSFAGAREIKIVPEYIELDVKDQIHFEDYEPSNTINLINKYIDAQKYPPKVKEIAQLVEDKILEKYTTEEIRGIHFVINKLSLSNFKPFAIKNPSIDFSKLESVIGIFGHNKLGKSALIEAIVWGLYGQTLRNKVANSVIRNGESQAWVEIELASHNEKYKLYRSRGTNSTVRFMHLMGETWVDISGSDVKVTQRNIEKIVGTFDMFISTVYSPQNNIDILIRKKPNERKQIILDCLQIGVLEKRQQEISELKKVYRDEYNLLKGRIDAYGESLTNILITEPQQLIDTYEDKISAIKQEVIKLTSRLTTLTKTLYEYENSSSEEKEVGSRLRIVQKEIDIVEEKIKNKEKERDTLAQLLADSSILTVGLEKLHFLEEELQQHAAEKERILVIKDKKGYVETTRTQLVDNYKLHAAMMQKSRQNLMDNLHGVQKLDCSKPDCPLNQALNLRLIKFKEQLDELDQNIYMEEEKYQLDLLKLNAQIEGFTTEISTSFYDSNKHINCIKELESERSKDWIKLKYQIDSGNTAVDSMQELISAYYLQHTTLVNERTELTKKRNIIAEHSTQLYKYKLEIAKVKEGVVYQNNIQSEYEKKIASARRDIEEATRIQKLLLTEQEVLRDKEELLNCCAKYSEIVGKNGVMYPLVDSALPLIEQFAQKIINETTNGMISISIDSYKTLSSGEKSDEVMIYISDSKGKRDAAEGSGSEIVLVSLALRAAMANLLSVRMGAKVELFILDEGFGVFDDDNLIAVKELIRKLGTRFNKVLFITHVNELKDVAQSTVMVTSDGSKSTFEVIGVKSE